MGDPSTIWSDPLPSRTPLKWLLPVWLMKPLTPMLKPESSLSTPSNPLRTPPKSLPPRSSTLKPTLKPSLSPSPLVTARSVKSSVSVRTPPTFSTVSPLCMPPSQSSSLLPASQSVKPPSPRPSSTPTTQLPTASTKSNQLYQNYSFFFCYRVKFWPPFLENFYTENICKIDD